MHIYSLAAILFAGFTAGSPADYNVLSALAPHAPTVNAAAPRYTPTPVRPTLDSIPPYIKDGLELRQAPGIAPVAALPAEVVAPAVPAAAPAILPAAIPAGPPPAVDPLAVPAPAPAVPAVALPPAAAPVLPIPAASTMALPALVTGDDFVTVQWVETRIGTLRTWVPKTQTFHFEAMSQAPLPGVGSIGMGTLTGTAGQTQTI